MTNITKQGNTITVEGHAGYDVPGKDIVCAAVSVLAYNLILSLQQLTSARIEFEDSPGNIKITIMESAEGVQLLVDSFFIGMGELAESYPNNIKLAKH